VVDIKESYTRSIILEVLFGSPAPDVNNNRFLKQIKDGSVEFLKGQWKNVGSDSTSLGRSQNYEASYNGVDYKVKIIINSWQHKDGNVRIPSKHHWEVFLQIDDGNHRGKVVGYVVKGEGNDSRRNKAKQKIEALVKKVFGIDAKII
jgi:hypothetical protein